MLAADFAHGGTEDWPCPGEQPAEDYPTRMSLKIEAKTELLQTKMERVSHGEKEILKGILQARSR